MRRRELRRYCDCYKLLEPHPLFTNITWCNVCNKGFLFTEDPLDLLEGSATSSPK